MNEIAIRVENLGKQYRIGAVQSTRYRTLRESISSAVAGPFRRAGKLLRGEAYGAAELNETIWALKDLSFEVKQGEIVGIIGRNGAGKSTLLKVLSRITHPSEGDAYVYGRVGSLLEVGTGFHPELTGRENIYLNGTILGMHRDEIDQKFDEIVEFAEIAKFIDTPLKHYSSGMGLRLGFAVAAHLEPEILLVDEVLAVGDVRFQQKCIGKMSDVAASGRTILFVSHNMAAARQLCQRGIVLQQGQKVYESDIASAIDYYTQSTVLDSSTGIIDTRNHADRTGIGGAKVVQFGCKNQAGNPTAAFGIGEPVTFWMDIEIEDPIANLVAGVEVRGADGTQLVNLRSDSQSIVFELDESTAKSLHIEVSVPGLPFYPGRYNVEPWFCQRLGKRIDHVHNAFFMTLEPRGVFKAERLIQAGRGFIMMDGEWDLQGAGEKAEDLTL